MENKAKELIEKYGKVLANNVCDDILDEIQYNYNQERIDYWLAIKNLINKM